MSTEELYFELSKINITITLLLAVALALIRPPKKMLTLGYRITLPAIIVALILIASANILLVANHLQVVDYNFMVLATLVVSSYQMFLFASTIISILDTRYLLRKKYLKELIPTTLLSITGTYLYFNKPETPLKVLFVIFGLYFASQIVRYTYHYLLTEKETIRKLDNFFSEEIFRSVKWTRTAYIGLFFCSIFSIVSLVQVQVVTIIFMICYTSYYVYFSTHYVNYVYLMMDIEPAFTQVAENTLVSSKSINRSFEQLEKAIEVWELNKKFTEPNINIEQVAQQLKTNRTYLSNYMNLYRKLTFKEWINTLRIEEAKRLMKEQPELPVAQIGVQVGIPDKSNFGRQFTRVTGMSPKAWRKK
jgi:AraC-like DNA-binding protein